MLKPQVLLTTAFIVGTAALSAPVEAAARGYTATEAPQPQISITLNDGTGTLVAGRRYRYCRGFRSRRKCAFHRFYHRRCKYRYGFRRCRRIFRRQFDRYDDGFDPYSSRYDDRFDRITERILDRVFDRRSRRDDYYDERRRYDDDD